MRNFLVIALLVISTIGLSIPSQVKNPIVVKITYTSATQDFGFIVAMYSQLDPLMIQLEMNGYYTAQVIYNSTTYVVFGTLAEWQFFFQHDIHDWAALSGTPPMR